MKKTKKTQAFTKKFQTTDDRFGSKFSKLNESAAKANKILGIK